MSQRFSDEAIVAVKREAEENRATYLRIKLSESAKERGGEGRNMLEM